MQTQTHAHDSHSSHDSQSAPPPSIHPLIQQSTAPVPLTALAELLGCTRDTIRHFADRLGFRFLPHRIGARREPRACLSAEQAAAITAAHLADVAAHPPAPKPTSAPVNRDLGYFYLIQLEPDFDPGRFKLGFTIDLEDRLHDFLTIAPLAKLIAAWPAHRSWEHTAIAATAQGATPLRQEVFRCESLDVAIANATRFFAAMPNLDRGPIAPPPLSLSPNPSLGPPCETSAAVTPTSGCPRDIGDPSFVGMTTNTLPRAANLSVPSRAAPEPTASPAAQPLWTACASAPLWHRAEDG